VDDACPDGSGRFIEEHNRDPRVRVLYNPENRGVGGAIVTAYQAAMADGMDIVVKIDGDGQMDPALLPSFVRPLLQGRADYTKGNRFFRPESVQGMPPVRLFGNAMLSFLTKLSCGYWNVMDPTNGYTAVRTSVLAELPLDKLEQRYFFETDMLFRLNTVRAVVKDIPMDSVYANEESNLKVGRVLPEFLKKHISRLWRRYVYNYLVRDFNVGTLYSLSGVLLLLAGTAFGTWHWVSGNFNSHPATSGTVMLAALPVLIGIQSLIAFLHYDVSNVPTEPLSLSLDHSALPPNDLSVS
jgi:glycosyltransferase involved in cell wall biosynthesis